MIFSLMVSVSIVFQVADVEVMNVIVKGQILRQMDVATSLRRLEIEFVKKGLNVRFIFDSIQQHQEICFEQIIALQHRLSDLKAIRFYSGTIVRLNTIIVNIEAKVNLNERDLQLLRQLKSERDEIKSQLQIIDPENKLLK